MAVCCFLHFLLLRTHDARGREFDQPTPNDAEAGLAGRAHRVPEFAQTFGAARFLLSFSVRFQSLLDTCAVRIPLHARWCVALFVLLFVAAACYRARYVRALAPGCVECSDAVERSYDDRLNRSRCVVMCREFFGNLQPIAVMFKWENI